MSLPTPKNGLKAVARRKWEAEQAAKAAEAKAKAAKFAATLAVAK
jgi:hypothetical protein